MEIKELVGNPSVRDISKIFTVDKPPIDVLKTISPNEFEDLTYGWVMEFLKPTKLYIDACQIGEGKDSGRDIVAYITEDRHNFDIYQCKRYQKTISPSEYFCELGKLCYYTFIKEYEVPKRYYLVTTRGVGKDLRYYFEHKDKIAEKLLEKWDDWCKNKISKTGVVLTKELQNYILSFNFEIINEISPGLFIEQVAKTRYYKYYFGGGIKKRDPIKDIESIKDEPLDFPFIQQLFSIYSMENNSLIVGFEDLKKNELLLNHFMRQYNSYLSYLSLVRFSREQLLDPDGTIYNFLKQIYYAIADSYEDSEKNTFKRVKATTKAAVDANINNKELGEVFIQDKIGACHELVNKEKIRWFNE